MSGKPRVATVFGGAGFIGRYIVRELAARDYMVRVAVRNAPATLFLQTMGRTGQIVPLYAPLGAEAQVARATEGAELVVNATGLLTEDAPGGFQPRPCRGGRAGRPARRQLRGAAARPSLGHRRRCGESQPLRAQQGGRRGSGARRFPEGGDSASLDRVRRRGQFFQPFRGDGLVPPGAAHRRRGDEIPAGLCRRRRRCRRWRRSRRRRRAKFSNSAARRCGASGSSSTICCE